MPAKSVTPKSAEPQTLVEAIRYFADPDAGLEFVAQLRWPDGATCPLCESKEVSFLSTRRIWKCKGCKKQFSVKLGTILEDSPIGLDKWLPALWMLANCKNGISSYELARGLGVTQKTAWFMLHRIRLAMQSMTFAQIEGEVEVDETFIGGAARFMHKKKRERIIKSTGPSGKAVVMGLLERHGPDKTCSTVRARVVKSTRRPDLLPGIREHVREGSSLLPMRSRPTLRSASSTPTTSSTMRSPTRKGTSTRTGWRTSGVS